MWNVLLICINLLQFRDYPANQVCTVLQIRAASLSGDCTFRQEVLRGNYAIRKQHQVQLWLSVITLEHQTALLSIMPQCTDADQARGWSVTRITAPRIC